MHSSACDWKWRIQTSTPDLIDAPFNHHTTAHRRRQKFTRMGGPLCDRLQGLLEGVANRPEIEAALAAADYPALIAHLTVRRRALPAGLLARVAEELASATASSGGGEEGPSTVPPAYLDLLRVAAAAAGEVHIN